MKIKYRVEPSDILKLESEAIVIKDNGDNVDIEWPNGDKSWVWKVNIEQVYRNNKVVYGTKFVNKLKYY